ncbi:MAG: hypothetical protein QXD10_07550 [Metallosphaera sp.]|nr:hypothetical protein [Candidatus Parvarchaeum tengchongense]
MENGIELPALNRGEFYGEKEGTPKEGLSDEDLGLALVDCLITGSTERV